MPLFVVGLLVICTSFSACQLSALPFSPSTDTVAEASVQRIPIDGPLSAPEAEISGLAWYGEHLILLPQHPDRFGGPEDGFLFTLSKEDILEVLDGKRETPLRPDSIIFEARRLTDRLPDFQGFEAIEVRNDRVFLTVEALPETTRPGYLVGGHISPDLSRIRLQLDEAVTLPPQTQIANISYEGLIAVGDTLVPLYEANGRRLNPTPRVPMYDLDLRRLGDRPFPSIEYRITDATTPDRSGYFWTINYFFPGEASKLKPAIDSLALRYGEGATHDRNPSVERLVQFQYTTRGIVRSDVPPLLLRLVDGRPRNWEALAQLNDRGFLIATDEHPETIFAFVPLHR